MNVSSFPTQQSFEFPGKYATFLMRFLLFAATLFPLWEAYLYHTNLNDDSYITLTYVRNLANGHGFVFNHPPATFGTTTPFFTIIIAVLSVILPHREVATLAVYFSALCWSGCAWLFLLFRAHWHMSEWQATVLGLAIIASGWVTFLGMETYLFAFLLILCLSLFYARQYFFAGITAGLLFLTRGEGILIFLIMVALAITPYLGTCKPLTTQMIRPAITIIVGFFIPLVFWFAYAYATFGYLLPNTLSAKRAQGQLSSARTLLDRLQHEWLPGWGLQFSLFSSPNFNVWWWLVGLGFITALLKRSRCLVFALWIGMYIVGYTLLRVSAYGWYQLPILFVFQLFAALGVIACIDFLSDIKRLRTIRLVVTICAAVLYILTLSLPTLEASRTYSGDPRSSSYLTLARWMREHTRSTESVAYIEIGYLGYYTDNRIIDLGGLVLPDVVAHIAKGDYAWGFWHYAPDYYVYLPDFDWALRDIRANPEFDRMYQPVATLPGPRETNFTIYKRVIHRSSTNE